VSDCTRLPPATSCRVAGSISGRSHSTPASARSISAPAARTRPGPGPFRDRPVLRAGRPPPFRERPVWRLQEPARVCSRTVRFASGTPRIGNRRLSTAGDRRRIGADTVHSEADRVRSAADTLQIPSHRSRADAVRLHVGKGRLHLASDNVRNAGCNTHFGVVRNRVGPTTTGARTARFGIASVTLRTGLIRLRNAADNSCVVSDRACIALSSSASRASASVGAGRLRSAAVPPRIADGQFR